MTPSSAPRLNHLNKIRRPVIGRSIALLVGFCALLIGIHGWSLWTARQGQLEQSAASTSNMARALAAQAETSLKIADAILGETVERIESDERDGLDGAEKQRLHRRFMNIEASTAEIHGVFFFGPDGRWDVTSLKQVQSGNNADREYFRYHQSHTDRKTHVGQPVRSRATGVMVLPVSRRIDNPDGSFGGVALVTLDLRFFGAFYDRFDVGRSGTILLSTDEGRLVYRRPFKEVQVGNDIRSGPIYQMYKSSGPVGTAMLRSKIDGIERLYSYRHLDNYPLIVASAQSKDEILAGWWIAVVKMSCVVAFAVAMLAWGGARMIRQIRIRERLEDELLLAGTTLQQHNVSLKALAESDGLTGLGNRRLFEATLEREVGRARRTSTPFALVLTDVDFFKKYNDRYGHVAGDECLRQVGAAIGAGARRPADLAARYGGEEFAVILPDTDLEGALAVAESIRAAVAAMQIAHADSPTGHVTLSLGVIAGHPAADGQGAAHGWVSAADQLLYGAKSGGRNRTSGAWRDDGVPAPAECATDEQSFTA
ncbi:diguanylate cyclase [Massilia forsythiae]|uniref:diguanylate cyclase n=1 Tax=Massilia forsythiae TaxID=2728020 RepID=A0A7Z2VTT9_9BURK|nr:GGDEF domain-containing protein [Massilia forsythiae]QJD98964.1 diguanylate cyclase [Massilia forsythiae]